MIKIISLTLLIILLFIADEVVGRKKKIILVDRLDFCETPENAGYLVHYIHLIHLKDRKYTLSAKVELLVDLESRFIEVDLHAIRCNSKEQLDTCQDYQTIKPNSVCNFLELKELGIRKTLDKFVPPIRCPFKKGNWTAPGVTYEIDQFTLFPIQNYYWKLKAHVYYQKKIFATACLEAQVIEVELH